MAMIQDREQRLMQMLRAGQSLSSADLLRLSNASRLDPAMRQELSDIISARSFNNRVDIGKQMRARQQQSQGVAEQVRERQQNAAQTRNEQIRTRLSQNAQNRTGTEGGSFNSQDITTTLRERNINPTGFEEQGREPLNLTINERRNLVRERMRKRHEEGRDSRGIIR